MSAKTRPKRAATQRDSIEAELGVEKKVIWFWQQMDQMYGVRWSQNFGNDPLGKYQNAEGHRNPPMEQWIETLGSAPWERLKIGVQQIKRHPKPYDGWLPDLPFVAAIVQPKRSGSDINLRPFAAWIGRLCDARLIRTIAHHGPFNPESLAKLGTVTRQAKEKFVAMVRAGDLSEDGLPEEVEVVNKYLEIEYRKLTITKLTPEQEQEARIRWQRARGLLQTPQRT